MSLWKSLPDQPWLFNLSKFPLKLSRIFINAEQNFQSLQRFDVGVSRTLAGWMLNDTEVLAYVFTLYFSIIFVLFLWKAVSCYINHCASPITLTLWAVDYGFHSCVTWLPFQKVELHLTRLWGQMACSVFPPGVLEAWKKNAKQSWYTDKRSGFCSYAPNLEHNDEEYVIFFLFSTLFYLCEWEVPTS